MIAHDLFQLLIRQVLMDTAMLNIRVYLRENVGTCLTIKNCLTIPAKVRFEFIEIILLFDKI